MVDHLDWDKSVIDIQFDLKVIAGNSLPINSKSYRDIGLNNTTLCRKIDCGQGEYNSNDYISHSNHITFQ